jgi:hypothetical protein
MGKKPRKGRDPNAAKPGPKPMFGETMAYRVTVVLNKKQADDMASVAAAANKSASQWAREILLANLPQELE